MIAFDAAHEAVHYPPDRRFRIWVCPSILVVAGAVVLSLIAAARIEFVVSEKTVGQGEGGKNEDDEYFDLLPNI